MALRVKPKIPYLPRKEIEAVANSLLARYEAQEGPIQGPPVPIEFMVEDFLGYTVKSEYLIGDTLAYIDPSERVICLNLNRFDYFDRIGSEYTLAHEIGHPELGHFEEVSPQLALDEPKRLLHRERPLGMYQRHEFQAEYFGSCLTVPKRLLLPAVEQYDLYQWPSVYGLAEQFNVSPTVMTKKLAAIGLIYVKDRKLYGSKEEANGQMRLF